MQDQWRDTGKINAHDLAVTMELLGDERVDDSEVITHAMRLLSSSFTIPLLRGCLRSVIALGLSERNGFFQRE